MKKRLIALILMLALIVPISVFSSAEQVGEERGALVTDGEAKLTFRYSGFSLAAGKSVYDNEADEKIGGLISVIEEMTGVRPNLEDAESNFSDAEIFVGQIDTEGKLLSKVKMRLGDNMENAAHYSYNTNLYGTRGFTIKTYGDRYVISGEGYGLWFALEYFATEILGYDYTNGYAEKISTLTIPKNIYYVSSEYFTGTDGKTGITIGGKPIDSYSILYTEGDDSYITLWRAIGALTGCELNCTTDTSVDGNRIVITVGDGDKPTVKYDGRDLVMSSAANAEKATDTAVELFLEKYFSLFHTVYTDNGDIEIPSDVNDTLDSDFEFSTVSGTDYTYYMKDSGVALLSTDGICYTDSASKTKLSEALLSSVENDTVYLISNTKKHCTCEGCKADYSGAYWKFVSEFATANPSIKVVTLAYRDTFKALGDKLPGNVRVIVADTEVCCGHSLGDASCETNKAYADNLAAWTKVCDDVYVADFTQMYYSYPASFPNLDTIRPNIAFYKSLGIKGVMMNWDYNEARLEFAALLLTLISNCLSNPEISDTDYEVLYKGTLESLYHTKADCFAEYIKIFDENSSEHYNIFSKPTEILPIKQNEDGSYDLKVAKKLAAELEKAYERHQNPEVYTGLKMHIFAAAVENSDYFNQLLSRVQFSEWVDACVAPEDHTVVYNEIVASLE